jgi:hypothetical protein
MVKLRQNTPTPGEYLAAICNGIAPEHVDEPGAIGYIHLQLVRRIFALQQSPSTFSHMNALP